MQGGGWLAYALLRFLNGLANEMGLAVLVPTLISAFAGFCLTLVMAGLFRRLMGARPVLVWTISALCVGVGAGLFSALEVWGHATFYDPDWSPRGLQFLGALLMDLYVLTSWTALYFGVNYYLLARQQGERLLRLAAQAHAAQLKMLRYQINPHFLFNTLNSISTLVLRRDAGQANAMLGRLARFLRHTLTEEPALYSTLAQEVAALELYLDIERLRFEERLQVRFEIDPDVLGAVVPSLLLQPLVENAIKYAVAPSETGAQVVIRAERIAHGLRLSMRDSGPGFELAGKSGVGLANIRDRLVQTYGSAHLFSVSAHESGGACVVIEIPLQQKDHSV